MINTILMDLDGTLLPFWQKDFVEGYFTRLCKQIVPLGYAPDDVVKAVWAGTKAMIKNDGSCLNADRFWDTFASMLGEEVRQTVTMLDTFYRTEFDTVREILQEETCAKEIVEILRGKGYTVVLATNPLFPAVAQHTRLAWTGLTPDAFAHITHYENSRYCKPNPRYYEEILDTIGKRADECLMIGNSVGEDMIAASLGMDVYLVEGYVENPDNLPTDGFKQGRLSDFLAYAKTLPDVNGKDDNA